MRTQYDVSFAWLIETLKADLRANIFLKSKIVLLMFRTAHYLACRNRLTLIVGLPFFVFYKFIMEWLLGMEIPIRTRVGKGFVIYHGFGLVIHGQTVIGEYCKIRQGVTLGNKLLSGGASSPPPCIGDHVEFGANSVVVGPVRVGDRAVIGAGAVVTREVPPGAVMVGIPAKQINIL